MDRKKFIEKTVSGLVAASFLPLLSFKSKKKLYKTYNSVEETEINGVEWLFEINIDDSLTTSFASATNATKDVAIYCESSNDKLSIIYKATSVEMKNVDNKNLHFFTLKIGKNEMKKEEINFGTDNFGKTFILEVHNGCHAVLRNKKTNLEIGFKYNDEDSIDNLDCFLTTASVYYKGLADDCYELTTLRDLREKVMKPNPIYTNLISEYGIIAPLMLININRAANKDEILEGIYTNLVLPSVKLVEEGKNQEAIEYYKDFVEVMKQRYII